MMRVILVDDEVEFVSALAERLSLRGIDADWISVPEEAIAKAEEECYDLAVLDMKMPRIGGIALKKRLHDQCPDMKFIFVTGHGSEQAFREGSMEADYYLLKPVQIEKLMAKISEALSGKPEEAPDA